MLSMKSFVNKITNHFFLLLQVSHFFKQLKQKTGNIKKVFIRKKKTINWNFILPSKSYKKYLRQ